MLAKFTYPVRLRSLWQEYGQSTVEFAALLTALAIFIVVLRGMANELRQTLGHVAHFIGTL